MGTDYDHSELDQAIYGLVHEHPGGARALAPLLRLQPGTLSNKANPSLETHHLSVHEAVAAQAIRHDTRVIEAEARALGGVYVRLPTALRDVSDVALLEAWEDWLSAAGDTGQAIRAALADGRVSGLELRRIRTTMHAGIARELELLARLEALADG